MEDAPEPTEGASNAAELVVLFERAVPSEPVLVQTALRAYDRRLAKAVVELEHVDEAGVTGVAAWDRTVVELDGQHAPWPASELEACLVHAHFGPELRERARVHGAHVRLRARSEPRAPLAAVLGAATLAGALASVGALVVAHPAARTSVPAALVARRGPSSLDVLSALALPLLVTGFGKYEPADGGSVWMRTHVAHRFGLPDLAFEARSHDEATEVVERFDAILRQLVTEPFELVDGAALSIDDARFLLRRLEPGEPTFDRAGPAWVLESIDVR